MTSLRRYAPFALLVATQMVLVLVAPSHGATSSGPALGGTFNGGTSAATSPAGGSAGAGGGLSSVPAPGAAPGGGAGSSTATGSVSAGGGTAPSGTQQLASGQTTNQKFCPTGLLDHLPCLPKWAGGDNGGATWAGVTKTTVTFVYYRPKENAAVNAILQKSGTYTPPNVEQQMVGVVQNWINSHFQLYGRQVKIIYYHSSACDIAPPVDSCFRTDADSIVSRYHPFAVVWPSDTNEPAFMDELSRKGVVNWGGWAFTDQFDDSLRPYHYDLFMGGDTQAEFIGTWYCRRLANKPARFAGSADLRVKMRKVAVIHPNVATVNPSARLLESIISKCDKNGAVDAPYESDTSTAARQSATDTAKYKGMGVTTNIWFSDLIAPAYGTQAEATQNWYPEQVVAGEGLLDYDALAQNYNQQEWAHAFGLSDIAQSIPVIETDAGHVWKEEGQSGSPNANSNLLTTYLLSMAGGVMAAGPKLTPLTYEYGMLTSPGYNSYSQWHDPRLEYVKYGKGDYTGISDVREVYYDPNLRSPNNGAPGGYVPLNNGRRYQLNEIPSGEPNLPSSV